MFELKGRRTIIANLVLSAPLILPIFSSDEFRALIPADLMPYYGLTILIVNVVLRALTDTAIGKSK